MNLILNKRLRMPSRNRGLVLKSKITIAIVTLITMVFFTGCANLPVPAVPGAPSAKSVVKKAVTESTLEVLDVTMEKVEWVSELWGEKRYGILIKGHAIYHPAKVGAEPFIEAAKGKSLYFALYDANGLKLPIDDISMNKDFCGEYGKPENVIPGEPFPFEKRESTGGDGDAGRKAIWDPIASIKFVKWE